MLSSNKLLLIKSGSVGEFSETYFRSYYKNGDNELVLLYLTEKRGGQQTGYSV